MPLYEYQCDACGRLFELIRKFSDPPLEECPHCGGTVHKLFSSPAIQFKGSGFYITDYAKKDQTPTSPSGETTSETASKEKDKGAAGEKGEKAEKSKTEKTEKGERAEKSDKSEKSDKPEKSPGRADAKTSSSGSDSTPAATSTAGKKDTK
jgi:putative FmdB family regulatory protein